MAATELALWAGSAILLYALLKHRLIVAMHPLRMRLADLSTQVINSGKLSEDECEAIDLKLKHAYNGWVAWAFVAILPIASIAVLIDTFRGKKSVGRHDGQVASDLAAINVLSIASVMAASPIAAVFFTVEFVALTLLFVPMNMAFRRIDGLLVNAESSFHRHGHAASSH